MLIVMEMNSATGWTSPCLDTANSTPLYIVSITPMISCVVSAVSRWGQMAADMSMAGILLRLLKVRYVTGDINAWVFRPITDMAHPPKHESTTIIQQCSPHSGLISWDWICVACTAAAAHTTGKLSTLLYHAISSVCLSLSSFESVSLIFVSTVYRVMEMICADAHKIPTMFARRSWLQYAQVPRRMLTSRYTDMSFRRSPRRT